MAAQATSKETEGSKDISLLREELARSREEVLRLRDLLIGKDAELGTARGRVAELEAGSARLLNLVARVRSLIPSFLLSAAKKLRKRPDADG